MNKSRLIFLIAFSFVCVMLFAIPTIGTFCSILMGIVPFLIAMFGFKDKTAASKTLQPYIILGAVAIVRLFFDFLFYIIITLGGSVDAQMAYIFIQVLLLIILFVLEIVALVFICLKKDAPVVGKWANKIVEIEEKAKAKKAAKKSTEDQAEEQQEAEDEE